MKRRKPIKRGRGRPPMSPGERRDAELRIRLTPGERAALDAAAQAHGEETSTWARALLLAKAGRPKRA